MEERNVKLKAIVKIRNLVASTVEDWNKIKSIGREADILTNSAISIIANTADEKISEDWSKKIQSYNSNLESLKEIMRLSLEKIQKREADEASKVWESHLKYSNNISEIIDDMQVSGINIINESKHNTWNEIWKKSNSKLIQIKTIADNSKLKLDLIKSFTPKEVDELTDAILKHMPKRYSEEEAEKYEKEYMQAYEEIKKESSKKKNLWDKLLDILAGGTNQSPAEKVMMQRWVDGEK